MEENVILVDENDLETGVMEKFEAHRAGALHRAVSVFLFNGGGQLLLQQRADIKYHSPGKWSNTCCTHPRPGESTLSAARRRLREEMGIDCEPIPHSKLLYRAEFENDLIEHEFDHIFVAVSNKVPAPDPAEVSAYRYVDLPDLQRDIEQTPQNYTAWLPLCLDRMSQKNKENDDLN